MRISPQFCNPADRVSSAIVGQGEALDWSGSGDGGRDALVVDKRFTTLYGVPRRVPTHLAGERDHVDPALESLRDSGWVARSR